MRPAAGVLLVPGLLLGGAALLGACGGSSSTASGPAVERTCQAVAAVLSDGPDPQADPVGYAEAQVQPLAGVHTTDAALQGAIDQLDRAYESFYRTGGAKTAAQAEDRASSLLDRYCPGAAP